MKHSFLLPALLLALSGAAQPPHGWFYTVKKDLGFQSELFHFDGEHFFFRSSGCLGSVAGQGTFVIRADRLMLFFEKSPADTGRVKPILPRSTATIPTFYFRLIDKASGIALPGIRIISKKTGVGAATDLNGEASFDYLPPTNDVLVVSSVGYASIDIPVHSAISQSYQVSIGPPYYFEAGDTLTFQLKDVGRNAFALRPRFDDDEIADDGVPYTHCSRIRAQAAKKINKRYTRLR